MDQRANEKPKKLLKTINFDYYQNHAFLTKDGNTLYFTSEAKGGVGGIDIYKSTKIKEGEWSKPENIGAPVNTEYDEDAPFVTEDGKTLYFASTGHEGFGNFDIYKSEMIDGKWSAPVNLGQPINSPANDIFMVVDNTSSVGYFSSSRAGGFGDMDIYKIVYLKNFNRDCPGTKTSDITFKVDDTDTTDTKNIVEAVIPANYKVLSYEWKVNGTEIENKSLKLDYDYGKPGQHIINVKVVAYCDTCLSPLVACTEMEFKPAKPKTDTAVIVTTPVTAVDLDKVKGELNSDQLRSLGFNVNPILFDFNKSDIRSDAQEIIRTNNEVLKKYPGLTLEIIGYTDSRGSVAYNRALSERRAASVKKQIAPGIKRTQIKFSTGKGVNEPVVDCTGKECDEAAHQQNRRVIFKVYSK
jgi:outer membrane protein OmpA-like peptidoglycan-associated protein